jgi:CheY-like chemotaxis protein
MNNSNYTILLVEDEENDATLMQRAFLKNDIRNPVQWVRDGIEAISYLNGEGEFADRQKHPFPEVLILDLKMPRHGRIGTARMDSRTPRIPSYSHPGPVIFTTGSRHREGLQSWCQHLPDQTILIRRIGETCQTRPRLLGRQHQAPRQPSAPFLKAFHRAMQFRGLLDETSLVPFEIF